MAANDQKVRSSTVLWSDQVAQANAIGGRDEPFIPFPLSSPNNDHRDQWVYEFSNGRRMNAK